MTKRYRIYFWLLWSLSLLLNVGPLTVYAIKALIESNLVHEKVTLLMTVFVVLIMTIINIVNRIALRSRLWIALIGIYICLDYILTPLIIIAVCQIVDELIVTPLKKHYASRLNISKEIDKRL